tara:strand:+ start:6921 stop:7148 length:228 start_codon:yes stop_codon:yes gene_type:complete
MRIIPTIYLDLTDDWDSNLKTPLAKLSRLKRFYDEKNLPVENREVQVDKSALKALYDEAGFSSEMYRGFKITSLD